MTTTAYEVIRQLLKDQGWDITGDANTITGTWRRRKISIAFHDKGSVISGFTVAPKPFNRGTQVLALQVPRRANALKFIRGEFHDIA